MHKLNEKLSISLYFFYISIVILLLCGITFLLSSCEEQIVDNSSSKKMIKVHFSLDNPSPGNEVISRSYTSKAVEPETVVIPLGGNMFMYTTLREERAVTTRAVEENLVENSIIRVVAYKDNSTTTIFISDHTVLADGSLDPGIMEVDEGEVYTFVAYGYNDGGMSLPFHDNNNVMFFSNPAFQFVCGIVPDIVVNDIYADVHIPVKRMYSWIKVEASTNLGVGGAIGFQAMGPIYITPYYSTPIIVLPEGTLYQALESPPCDIDVWDPVPDINAPVTTTVSESKVFASPYFFGSQIKVEFDSVTIGGKTFPQNEHEAHPAAYFTIEPNKIYTLQVNFSATDFAVSNIYWDDIAEELTFERAVSDGGIMGGPDNKQDYQGLFFKFGSLVGISPRDANFDVGNDAVNGTDGTPIYVPDDINTRTWKKTNTATAYGGGATWSNIIPASADYDIPKDPNNRFVMESAQNQPAKWANWTGDICQYIDNRYRLPTAYELWGGALEGDIPSNLHYYRYEDTSSGWESSGDWNTPGGVNDSGTGIWAGRGATLRGAYFPGGEYLSGTGSWVIRTNYWEGAYWSGTIHVNYSNQYGAYLKLGHEWMTLGDFFYETDSYAMAIRCVRK